MAGVPEATTSATILVDRAVALGPMPSLAELEREASACTRCPLARGRTNVVFGVGDPHADLMFVGEGPGAQEDLQGEPFVGRSGKLLDQLMQEELGFGRDRCYIANVVKCLRYTAMVQLGDGSWESTLRPACTRPRSGPDGPR